MTKTTVLMKSGNTYTFDTHKPALEMAKENGQATTWVTFYDSFMKKAVMLPIVAIESITIEE